MRFAFDQPCLLHEGNVLMESVREYILRIVVAAIVCAIAKGLLKEKTATGKTVNLVSGLLMAITIIAPLANISFQNIANYYEDITADAGYYVDDGKTYAKENTARIIKSQTEAYILDKAKNLDLQIAVEVELDDSNNSVPCGVVISGAVSPYAKGVLGAYMQEQLGIPKENQQWN